MQIYYSLRPRVASMPSEEHTPSFSESSPFVRLLRNPSRVKIVDVLLRRPQSDLTASAICELADIDRSTFSRNKQVFIDMGFVSVDNEGKETVYSLNADSESVKRLGKAHSALLTDADSIFPSLAERESDSQHIPTESRPPSEVEDIDNTRQEDGEDLVSRPDWGGNSQQKRIQG